MTLLMLAITLAVSAQNTVDDLIGKLLKSYPQTPSREMLDKDPETGKLLQHITEYSFRDIKPKKFAPLINALRDPKNGYYTQENTIEGNGYVYELRIADADPDFRTVYILESKGNDADLHVLYGKMPYSEMSTNFSYSPDKYYTIVNLLTGAKLGISFDYNHHASAYKESAPSGQGPNGIVITDNKRPKRGSGSSSVTSTRTIPFSNGGLLTKVASSQLSTKPLAVASTLPEARRRKALPCSAMTSMKTHKAMPTRNG